MPGTCAPAGVTDAPHTRGGLRRLLWRAPSTHVAPRTRGGMRRLQTSPALSAACWAALCGMRHAAPRVSTAV
eukprot:354055-Chlamydomonas_euryale.AAC.2